MEGVLPLPPDGSSDAEVEVLVVGAGPVGLLLACILQQARVKVALVDPHIAAGQQSKAAVTMPRSFEIMDMVGAGADTAARGRPLQSAVFGLDRKWVGCVRGFVVKSIPTRYTPVATGQPLVEECLRKRYAELGGRLYQAARFVSYTETAEGVGAVVERSVYVRPPAKAPDVPPHLRQPERTTFRAKFLVGCDGKQSGVRNCMGVGYQGKAYPQSFFLADAIISDEEAARAGLNDHEFYIAQESSAGRIGLMVHLTGSLWRCYYAGRDIDGADLSEAFLRQRLQQLYPPPGPQEMELKDLALYTVDCRLVDSYRKGCCFLAGDAAHCHSPAGGQGMNTGLQDAGNLGWKLAAVLKGQAPVGLLDSYELERRPVAEWVLSVSDSLFSQLTDQQSAFKATLRTLALRAALNIIPETALPPRVLRERLLGLSISYADCSTCRDLGMRAPSGALVAGQRLPDLPCSLASTGSSLSSSSLSSDPSLLQLLNATPGCAFLLLYVACSPPKSQELEQDLQAFVAHAAAGVLLQPCLYVVAEPCCLDGCFSWAKVNSRVLSKAGEQASPQKIPAPLVLSSQQPRDSLAQALRLRGAGGRAVLVVRPDGYIAVALRGKWCGREVVQAMVDLSLWPRL